MSNILEIISSRLDNRDLVSCEINRLIKDVSNFIDRKRNHELAGLKQALKNLGWEEHILDYHTLELICLYLEGRQEIKAYSSELP